jgi:hypothetical protein
MDRESLLRDIDSLVRKGRGGKQFTFPARVMVKVPGYWRTFRGKRVYQPGYEGEQTRWLLASTIKRDKLKIDEAAMIDNHLTFPSPESPERYHVHWGVYDDAGREMPHSVSDKHEDIEVDVEHRDEMLSYYNDWYHSAEDDEPKTWQDKYNVTFNLVKLKMGKAMSEEDKLENYLVNLSDDGAVSKYSFKEDLSPMYLFEHRGKVYLYSSGAQPVKFDTVREAVDAIRVKLESKHKKKKIKKSIEHISEMMSKSSDTIEKDNNEVIFSKYQSGDEDVELHGKDGHYVVKVNRTQILETDKLREALTKFYSMVHKVIRNNANDKDIAMDILGDHVVMNNRKILPMIAKLGDHEGMKFLNSFEYDVLEEFIKYEPQSGIVAGVPVQREQDSPDDKNLVVGRKDLTDDDYKKNKSICAEKPIEEEKERRSIVKEGVGMIASPEDKLEEKNQIAPTKVADNYSRTVRNKEQEPIIGKDLDAQFTLIISTIKKSIHKEV